MRAWIESEDSSMAALAASRSATMPALSLPWAWMLSFCSATSCLSSLTWAACRCRRAAHDGPLGVL